MYYKEIICLANSRKLSHRCIAGKEVETHEWIRPISSRETGELTRSQIRYDNREIPKILDIIKIPFNQEKPEFCQPENELISAGKWEKLGRFSETQLDYLCDNPATIWKNFTHYNDRISEDYIRKHGIKSSLLLIKPESVILIREDYYDGRSTRKKLRARFSYKNEIYSLVVTDPIIETEYKERDVGTYKLTDNNIYFCISLGEPYEGDCYKLIASIILF